MATPKYENMSHQQRLDMWHHYRNACKLAVTYQARTDPETAKLRNQRVERIYNKWIRYFTAKDISYLPK